jgi:putative transposase
MLAYKAKLQLNKLQKSLISKTILDCVELYNTTIELASEQTSIPSEFTMYSLMKEFDIATDIAQGTIDRACKSVVRSRIPDASGKRFGKPRHKTSKVLTNSFGFPLRTRDQHFVRQIGRTVRVHIPKLGWVKARIGRQIEGLVKQVGIKCDTCGDYWLTIVTDYSKEVSLPDAITDSLGVDLGIKTTVSASNTSGTVVVQPERKQFLDNKNLKALKHAANDDPKALPFVHRKIARRRDDYNWKLARKVVSTAENIYVGNVSVKWLISGKLARQASDIAPSSLKNKMSCLAASAGRHFQEINEAYTSKTCSNCGHVKDKLKLSERIYECFSCNFILDRDLNAARNICKKGEQLRLYVTAEIHPVLGSSYKPLASAMG